MINTSAKNGNVNVMQALKCMYTNADSLPNKLNELRSRIKSMNDKPALIAITEIYPKNCRFQPTIAELKIPGYQIHTNEDSKECKRGIAIYISTEIEAVEIKIASDFKEQLWLKINVNKNDKLLVGCMYRSPNSEDANTEEMLNVLKQVTQSNISDILIMGDFNYPNINWNTWASSMDKDSTSFIECIRDCFLWQHIKSPTRGRINNKSHILDLILTKEENKVSQILYESPLGSSDHSVINYRFHCLYNTETEYISRKNYFKGDYTKMKEKMSRDWDEIFNFGNVEADVMLKSFVDLYKCAEVACIPTIKNKNNQKAKEHNFVPLNNDAIKKIQEKHRRWKQYLKTKEERDYREYTKLRNQVKGMIRKAKSKMEQEIAKQVKTNPKRFWQYANSKRKTNVGISELKYRNKEGEQQAVTSYINH